MKIVYVEGTDRNELGINYIEYRYLGRIHTVSGACVYYYPCQDLKVYFRDTKMEAEGNTLYIVKQDKAHQKYQRGTVIHELLHWLVRKFTYRRYLHNLIDKYLV